MWLHQGDNQNVMKNGKVVKAETKPPIHIVDSFRPDNDDLFKPISIKIQVFKGEIKYSEDAPRASHDDKLLANMIEKKIQETFAEYHMKKTKSAIDI